MGAGREEPNGSTLTLDTREPRSYPAEPRLIHGVEEPANESLPCYGAARSFSHLQRQSKRPRHPIHMFVPITNQSTKLSITMVDGHKNDSTHIICLLGVRIDVTQSIHNFTRVLGLQNLACCRALARAAICWRIHSVPGWGCWTRSFVVRGVDRQRE